jgi:hypothetical protein
MSLLLQDMEQEERHTDVYIHQIKKINSCKAPWWDWYQLTGRDERKEYLRAKLHIS